MTSARVAIFARVPIHGRVKTRLAATVGAGRALEVYESLLATTLCKLAPGRGRFEPEVWLDGDLGSFTRWQRQNVPGGAGLGFALARQQGNDLGQRMAHAFLDGVVVVVGTDIPGMSAGYVEQALAALTRTDVVIGPTEDGGYCLIAMNTPRPELFEGIPWSTPDVLTATIQAAGTARVELLAPMWDVDDVDDLVRWRGGAAGGTSTDV